MLRNQRLAFGCCTQGLECVSRRWKRFSKRDKGAVPASVHMAVQVPAGWCALRTLDSTGGVALGKKARFQLEACQGLHATCAHRHTAALEKTFISSTAVPTHKQAVDWGPTELQLLSKTISPRIGQPAKHLVLGRLKIRGFEGFVQSTQP